MCIRDRANIEKAIVSKLTAARGRGKSVTFDPASYGPSDKRGRSPGREAGKAAKAKVAHNKCDYPLCRHRDSHSRADCRLAKAQEREGLIITKKP